MVHDCNKKCKYGGYCNSDSKGANCVCYSECEQNCRPTWYVRKIVLVIFTRKILTIVRIHVTITYNHVTKNVDDFF
jgi:hypothetical protein